MNPVQAALLGAILAALVTYLVVRGSYLARVAELTATRDALRDRLADLQAQVADDGRSAALLSPLAAAVTRVEQQVAVLERDRVEQFGHLGARLSEVSATTSALRDQTATLVGSLNASSVRGAWGEVQLRRVLEHAGMLARCDFDEQVSAVSGHDRSVRPDVVVRLPGQKVLVIDAKAPMTAFLAAQADSADDIDRRRLLTEHAKALRGHVDALAAKAYWTAFETTPEMVVCFLPGDAVLAAALLADPGLYDHAQRSKVVLVSPATLLALLRTVAYTWQQDTLTANARELLKVGVELYERLGNLGQHATAMGKALTKSVEAYNGLIGSLESRALASARRMRDLGVHAAEHPVVEPVTAAPRPLTAPELLDHPRPEDDGVDAHRPGDGHTVPAPHPPGPNGSALP